MADGPPPVRILLPRSCHLRSTTIHTLIQILSLCADDPSPSCPHNVADPEKPCNVPNFARDSSELSESEASEASRSGREGLVNNGASATEDPPHDGGVAADGNPESTNAQNIIFVAEHGTVGPQSATPREQLHDSSEYENLSVEAEETTAGTSLLKFAKETPLYDKARLMKREEKNDSFIESNIDDLDNASMGILDDAKFDNASNASVQSSSLMDEGQGKILAQKDMSVLKGCDRVGFETLSAEKDPISDKFIGGIPVQKGISWFEEDISTHIDLEQALLQEAMTEVVGNDSHMEVTEPNLDASDGPIRNSNKGSCLREGTGYAGSGNANQREGNVGSADSNALKYVHSHFEDGCTAGSLGLFDGQDKTLLGRVRSFESELEKVLHHEESSAPVHKERIEMQSLSTEEGEVVDGSCIPTCFQRDSARDEGRPIDGLMQIIGSGTNAESENGRRDELAEETEEAPTADRGPNSTNSNGSCYCDGNKPLDEGLGDTNEQVGGHELVPCTNLEINKLTIEQNPMTQARDNAAKLGQLQEKDHDGLGHGSLESSTVLMKKDISSDIQIYDNDLEQKDRESTLNGPNALIADEAMEDGEIPTDSRAHFKPNDSLPGHVFFESQKKENNIHDNKQAEILHYSHNEQLHTFHTSEPKGSLKNSQEISFKSNEIKGSNEKSKNPISSNTEKDTKFREKKKRAPPTEERKAKKKMVKKRKRAEMNRKLGVKRLKLQPILKPKVLSDCKFHLSGRCREGEKCKFSHDAVPLTKSQPCKHFAKRSCLKGDDCPYDHQLSKYPCFSYISGGCSRGDACMFSHQIPNAEDQPGATNTVNPETSVLLHRPRLDSKMNSNGVSGLQGKDLCKDASSKKSHMQRLFPKHSMQHVVDIKPKVLTQAPAGLKFLSFAEDPLDEKNKKKEGSLPFNATRKSQIEVHEVEKMNGMPCRSQDSSLSSLQALKPVSCKFTNSPDSSMKAHSSLTVSQSVVKPLLHAPSSADARSGSKFASFGSETSPTPRDEKLQSRSSDASKILEEFLFSGIDW